jgi:glycosyltransferase involved in cell wall biosynthesis
VGRPDTLPHVGFVLERSLGHLTHAETLSRLVPTYDRLRADIAQLPFDVEGWPRHVPLYRSNWTLRAGVRARRAVREMSHGDPLDALFVNTQVSAVLLPDVMRRIPTVVSLDATPLQLDEFADAYDHRVHGRAGEHLRWRMNRLCFSHAAHIVTWSSWAKQGVVDGYGVPPEHVTVLPPGVRIEDWRAPAPQPPDAALHVLFVGGDLERKGGDELLKAIDELRREPPADGEHEEVVLDLVTRADVEERPGVRVHRGLTPNSPDLLALFHRADVFVLPTKADCLGVALLEAGAAGLPLVSTGVAGIPEIVIDGETGLMVEPGSTTGLVAALRKLVDDESLRRRLGAAASEHVARNFDAEGNTGRLVDLMLDVAARGRAVRRR